MAEQLCVAAAEGDVSSCLELTSQGADVNEGAIPVLSRLPSVTSHQSIA